MLKQINIFIGGSATKNVSYNYLNAAEELARKIDQRDYKIIFDGCSGLPSIIFENLTGFNRAIICYTKHYQSDYVNESFYSKNWRKINQAIQLKDQSEMTDTVIDLADALIFMKGKMGTLEEIFRVINGKKNKEYDKPVVILNINHEWDDLINLLNSCNVSEFYYVADNIVDCLNYIETSLYAETSNFYKLYVENNYIKRLTPIIEADDISKKL